MAVVVLGLAVSPAWEAPGARAAAVSSEIVPVPKAPADVYRTTFLADPGEPNRLTIRHAGSSNVFTEAALALRAGALCSQVAPGSASCPVGETTVMLGDGDDWVDADGWVGTVDGGPGDDHLTGGVRLIGGLGSDSSTGIPLPGADPSDFPDLDLARFVDGGAGERDFYRGATGHDTVSYEGRKTPVRVSLGSAANEDALVGIRSIVDGDGDDVITGDAAANRLLSGKGRDRLTGGKGDDVLQGNGDGDRLDGGPGNDRIVVLGGRDRVRCGPGTDHLVSRQEFSRPVRVPRDCETAGFLDSFTVAGAPRRRGRSAFVRVRRVETDVDRISIFAGGRTVGRSRRVRRAGTYRIKLNRAGRRLVRRGRTVILRNTPGEGRRTRSTESSYSFRVR